MISDDVWNSDGVHDSGYEQNAGTVTDSAGGKIEAGGKTDAAKADEGDKADTGKADDSGGKADSKKNDSKGGAASQASGGTSGSSASGSSPAQSQKKWVPEQGHWETDYGQVWVPNVVYVRHERYWVVTPNGNVGPFDSKSAANTWVYNDMVSGGKGGSLLDDSYTTSEDQGHYEQQATGKHWVVDVAGHGEEGLPSGGIARMGLPCCKMTTPIQPAMRGLEPEDEQQNTRALAAHPHVPRPRGRRVHLEP